MSTKKTVFVLAVICSCSLLTMGCTAIDAIVCGPEKHFGKASPQRLAVIAQTFEEQERFDQAQFMYKQLLKADPANPIAAARLQYLASAGSSSKLVISGAAPVAVAEAEIRRQVPEQSPIENFANSQTDYLESRDRSDFDFVRTLTPHARSKPFLPQVGGVFEESAIALIQNVDALSGPTEIPDWDPDRLDSSEAATIKFVSLANGSDDSDSVRNALNQHRPQV